MEQTAGSDFCRLASWQATVKITVSQTQTYDWCAHSMLPYSPSEILYIVYNIVRIDNKINIVKHYFTFFFTPAVTTDVQRKQLYCIIYFGTIRVKITIKKNQYLTFHYNASTYINESRFCKLIFMSWLTLVQQKLVGCRRVMSSSTCHHVDWCVVTYASEEFAASIFRVVQLFLNYHPHEHTNVYTKLPFRSSLNSIMLL